MFLKNYTSEVPSHQTIFNCQKLLIGIGVQTISMEYGLRGEVIGITFAVQLEGHKRPTAIKLPANVEGALDAFWRDYVGTEKTQTLQNGDEHVPYNGRKQKRRSAFLPQAERTAWKLMQDWLEVQISMIQMKQADFVQVFLPYVYVGGKSFYSRLKGEGFLALEGPKEDRAP